MRRGRVAAVQERTAACTVAQRRMPLDVSPCQGSCACCRFNAAPLHSRCASANATTCQRVLSGGLFCYDAGRGTGEQSRSVKVLDLTARLPGPRPHLVVCRYVCIHTYIRLSAAWVLAAWRSSQGPSHSLIVPRCPGLHHSRKARQTKHADTLWHWRWHSGCAAVRR